MRQKRIMQNKRFYVRFFFLFIVMHFYVHALNFTQLSDMLTMPRVELCGMRQFEIRFDQK